jgi:hypothetical protein
MCHWLLHMICGFTTMQHWPILGHRPNSISTHIFLVDCWGTPDGIHLQGLTTLHGSLSGKTACYHGKHWYRNFMTGASQYSVMCNYAGKFRLDTLNIWLIIAFKHLLMTIPVYKRYHKFLCWCNQSDCCPIWHNFLGLNLSDDDLQVIWFLYISVPFCNVLHVPIICDPIPTLCIPSCHKIILPLP